MQTVNAVSGTAGDGVLAGAPDDPLAGPPETGDDCAGVAEPEDAAGAELLLRSSRAMTIAPIATITAQTTAVTGQRYLFMSPPLDHF